MKYSLGKAIKDLRIQADKGLREFATIVGIPANTLSQIENGHIKSPSDEVVESIFRELAKLLGIDKDLLMIQAGKVSDDVIAYLHNCPESMVFLRKAATNNRDKEYWDSLNGITKNEKK